MQSICAQVANREPWRTPVEVRHKVRSLGVDSCDACARELGTVRVPGGNDHPRPRLRFTGVETPLPVLGLPSFGSITRTTEDRKRKHYFSHMGGLARAHGGSWQNCAKSPESAPAQSAGHLNASNFPIHCKYGGGPTQQFSPPLGTHVVTFSCSSMHRQERSMLDAVASPMHSS